MIRDDDVRRIYRKCASAGMLMYLSLLAVMMLVLPLLDMRFGLGLALIDNPLVLPLLAILCCLSMINTLLKELAACSPGQPASATPGAAGSLSEVSDRRD